MKNAARALCAKGDPDPDLVISRLMAGLIKIGKKNAMALVLQVLKKKKNGTFWARSNQEKITSFPGQ
jgi:hypothetical protein